MESKEILEILKSFEENDTYKKIFINGRWGIGKSFYTNQYICEKENAVYVSLFGKNKIETIQEEITKELFKKINSSKKFIKKGKELAKKITGSISCYGISINTPQMNSKSFIEEYSTILKNENNLIIVIDDLERKSREISIEDILGLIEELSLFENIKIVLIGDESKICDKDKEKWHSFKEKIIEKEYKVSKFSKDAIEEIIILQLQNYIKEEELRNFIYNFLEQYKIKNLRTIKKGINLFLEIENNHIYKNNESINLIILKNCMAVSIEVTEKLFEPIEENKDTNSTESFSKKLDEDIEMRINRHYFNSTFIINREAVLISYVLKIFKGDYIKKDIDEFNNIIEQYLNQKEEKNIFYLDEKSINQKVTEIYNKIITKKYKFSSLEQLIEDNYNMLHWYTVFEKQYDKENLKKEFVKILFNHYYNGNRENCYIDKFHLKFENCPELHEFIDQYNNEAKEKYYTDKMNYIGKMYEDKNYDINNLRWIEMAFIQSDKKVQFERFIKVARKDNYFIPDLSNEIDEKEWHWVHYVWNIFFEYMDKEYKEELNIFIETLKGNNKLKNLRIKILQDYKPLV